MDAPPTPTPPSVPEDQLQSALHAFKKRIKLMKLDQAAKLGGHRPTTSRKKTDTMGVVPPTQSGPAVWGELHVADGASCKATIEAGKVTVDGLIEGNVTAKDKIELTARARLKGDLISAKLLVAEGASFTGHVTVGPEYAKAGGAKHDPAM